MEKKIIVINFINYISEIVKYKVNFYNLCLYKTLFYQKFINLIIIY